MRDIKKVISAVVDEIPPTEEVLISDLKKLLTSCRQVSV
jgi:hypothetical protein